MTQLGHSTRVLVIDDEVQMRRLLQRTLEEHGHKVALAGNGTDGLAHAGADRPDLVILDLGLPDMDGIDVLKQLRTWSSTPVLVLSVRDAEEVVVRALDSGADDYLTKPFRTGELHARLRALLRHRESGDEETVVSTGPITVDLTARTVTKNGEPVKLTPTEYSLLALFARNAGKVLTHSYILQQIWGPAFIDETQYLRVFVGQLRKKLEEDPARPALLVTESGVGYRLSD